MIIDSLKNHKTYAAIHPRFARAFDFLTSTDLAALPDGRTDIEGDQIYVTVTRGPLRSLNEVKLEAHERYIDIQVVVSGIETFGWAEIGDTLSPRGEMDYERDILYYDDSPTTHYTVRAGQMSIFFPHDVHAPMIGSGEVVKCVVKVLA